MSSQLFSISMDGCMREVKAEMGNVARLRLKGVGWSVVAYLWTTLLLADNVRELQIVVDELYNVCLRRKLKIYL